MVGMPGAVNRSDGAKAPPPRTPDKLLAVITVLRFKVS